MMMKFGTEIDFLKCSLLELRKGLNMLYFIAKEVLKWEKTQITENLYENGISHVVTITTPNIISSVTGCR